MQKYTEVVISIKPDFIKKILSGKKTYEFRRQPWTQKTIVRAYIYASSPIQKIIGYFTVNKIIKGYPEDLWAHCKEEAGIEEFDFFEYFKGVKLAYAIKIADLMLFIPPIEPERLIPRFHAPQNFSYIKNRIRKEVANTHVLSNNIFSYFIKRG